MTNRTRATRRPIGTGDVLTAAKREGYVRRYVNDQDGRVERFLEAGYQIVIEPDADTSADKAGKPTLLGTNVRKSVGGGRHAVLMEIKEEFYNEDQEAKQEQVDALENAMEPNAGEGQFGKVSIKRG